MKYWLMKTEPGTYSIDDLLAEPDQTDYWDGVRNYQARNFMRDDMKKGDLAFFYHSSCDEVGIVGIMEVVREAYADHTADQDMDDPTWIMVDVAFKKKFKRTITLKELKAEKKLKNMGVVQRCNRLSIQPVTAKQWEHVLTLE